MMMQYEWGPWVEHDGKGCPVVGQYVHVVVGPDDGFSPKDDNSIPTGCIIHIISNEDWLEIAQDDDGWNWVYGWYPVIRYRVRRPLVAEWLQSINADMPVTEDA